MSGISRREVEVSNPLGLHLRPASAFVQKSQQFQAKIRISFKGRVADGRSILDLMLLAADCGARLELEAIGPDAEEAATILGVLIEEGFLWDEGGRAVAPIHDSLSGEYIIVCSRSPLG